MPLVAIALRSICVRDKAKGGQGIGGDPVVRQRMRVVDASCAALNAAVLRWMRVRRWVRQVRLTACRLTACIDCLRDELRRRWRTMEGTAGVQQRCERDGHKGLSTGCDGGRGWRRRMEWWSEGALE